MIQINHNAYKSETSLQAHWGGGKIIEIARDDERGRVLYFYSEKCVGCGLYESVCPKGAIEVYRNGRNFAVALGNCAVCGLCSDFCQFGALQFYADGRTGSFYRKVIEDELGYRKIEISDDCILCGLCQQNCPRVAIKVLREVDLTKLRKGEIRIGDSCINCRLCVESCPTKAIRIYHGRPTIDPSKCIYCEICARICPMDILEVRCDSCRAVGEASSAVSGKVVVDEQSCSTCGICSEVCPVGAIKVNKITEGEQKWDSERCFVDCTVCRDICPNQAISYTYEPSKIVVFSDRCNYCGACQRYCPSGAIEIERRLAYYAEVEIDFKKTAKHRKLSLIHI